MHREFLNLTTSSAMIHAKDVLLAANSNADDNEIKKAQAAAKQSLDKDPRWQLMNRWKIFTGVDSDYELVKTETVGKNQSEYENNLWFCGEAGRKVHTIFERERGHIDLGTHPIGKIDSHEKKCRKWLQDHQNKVEAI